MNSEYTDLMTPWYQTSKPTDGLEACASVATLLPQSLNSQSLVETAYRDMLDHLYQQLMGYIYVQDAQFFERLVVDVVFALGYGGRRRDLARSIGRSGDGGIDGIIALDELGLDVIYLQAKRLKPGSLVPVSAIRDFAGSLDVKHASKGVFVTTGNFSPAAHLVVKSVSKKIVLINGQKLTELMVRHNIGVKAKETMQFKMLDLNYFTAANPAL